MGAAPLIKAIQEKDGMAQPAHTLVVSGLSKTNHKKEAY
jgi:hypothetical protein